MSESPLNEALRHFEAVEANIVKLEKILEEISSQIPDGVDFTEDPEYEDNCRVANDLWDSLPPIDDWKPSIELMDRDEIAQKRLDAIEIGEIEISIALARQLEQPEKLLRAYKYEFNKKRRQLVADSVDALIDATDEILQKLSNEYKAETDFRKSVDSESFSDLKGNISQIDTLLGSAPRPQRWTDLQRHLHFGLITDLNDIVRLDWPSIKSGLRKSVYGEKEPIPIEISDLGEVVRNRPKGPVLTKLNWDRLSNEDFERLIFVLISSEKGYENPEWLTSTNAPDRGRDLSVTRVQHDSLGGTTRQRILIQCKHWLSRSVSPSDVATLREQMRLWEPPRVDVHVIATTGRFTSDAVSLIEKQNHSDDALRIEMWPESHLERLLASRPRIIAEFSLRESAT